MFSADRYLDRSYDRRRYHCWHLLCEAWRDLTGDELGLDTPGWDQADVAARFDSYERVSRPRSPSVVLMLRPPGVPHVGLFRNGRVLHIREDGVRNERLADATRGFDEVRYYAKRDADREPAGA